jgi:hypothetical protein
MNRKELIAALREGVWATDGIGAKLMLLYPTNPIMQAAADEIEAMEEELRDLLLSHAIVSDRYIALRNFTDKNLGTYHFD